MARTGELEIAPSFFIDRFEIQLYLIEHCKSGDGKAVARSFQTGPRLATALHTLSRFGSGCDFPIYSSSWTSWSTPRGMQTTSAFNSPQALCFTPRGT